MVWVCPTSPCPYDSMYVCQCVSIVCLCMFVCARLSQCLSVCFYCLLVFVRVCPCVSVPVLPVLVRICPYLSMFVHDRMCPFLSVLVRICPCLSVCFLFVRVCLLFVRISPCLSVCPCVQVTGRAEARARVGLAPPCLQLSLSSLLQVLRVCSRRRRGDV